MSVAISISPELMIMDKSAGASYRLDSGKEDFNRVISSDKLGTLNFSDISIDGFDSYLYFKDLSAVSSFVKHLKNNGDAADPTPYSKELQAEDTIVIVYGRVSIELADSSSTSVELCRPVYRVYPAAKTKELYAVQDIRRYISDTWREECKEALFCSGEDASQRFGVVKRFKESERLQLRLLKLVLAFATLIIAIIAIGAVVKDQGIINAANAQSHSSNPSATSLMNANNTPSSASPSLNPASVVYGGGYAGQEGQATVEDFARLQVEQRESMLQDMGVNVQSGAQNLGCFAEERS
jgi:hypothetical protein